MEVKLIQRLGQFCFWRVTHLVAIVRFLHPTRFLALLSLTLLFGGIENHLYVFFEMLGVFAAIPISTASYAHYSALMSWSRFSQHKLETADREWLTPFANPQKTNDLLKMFNASSPLTYWSAIWRQWYASEHLSLQNKLFPVIRCASWIILSTGL